MAETERKEQALLVGINNMEDEDDFDRSMEELERLAQACNMETVGILTQKLETVNNALYLGSGKVQELKEFAENIDADIIVFDNSLTPTQLRNLQQILKKPILDRTSLILDIFSERARTREAKLQVETAKLQYLLPRLVGMHEALSRQGGGSGLANKGAGEKKLELDRRKIEHRLAELRRELEEVAEERETQRKKRLASSLPLVALVGYTNAGKSTLLNRMIDKYAGDESKKVLEKDMLFATLETTVRKIELPDRRKFLLSDTVGFIHKLPPSLIKAFRSTLEEIKNADLLLHVIDYADKNYKKQIAVTEKTLEELGCASIPVIYVYNKSDLCMDYYPKVQGGSRIYMAAGSGEGMNELLALISQKLFRDYKEAEFLIPYDKGQIMSYLMENALLKDMEYTEKGIYLKAACSKEDHARYEEYLNNDK
ncbi:MAG: GTPase HflX [Lachnospiraceae bacterium]|jgi:GTP-binding protein HflX|nr:GTPase HflX [Lachnospiraceae bacterium]